MSGEIDIVKGRIKEAIGVLTDDEKLREAGQTDQTVGKVKQTAQKVVDAARDAAEKTIEATVEVAKKAVEKAKNAKG
ncbi:MAG TPA: CsbD family protein [Planctomycetaceae bacterium]|nr:CsbD family protein [Planctomycetaceae bacterium]